jgi:hypothetical protein
MYTLKWRDLSEIEVPDNLSYWYTETVNKVSIYSEVNVIKYLSTVSYMCKTIVDKWSIVNNWMLNVAEFERHKVIILNSIIKILERELNWDISA